MSGDNVIPFRKRPPSEAELDVYRKITRAWHPQLKEMLFPELFQHDQEKGARSKP